MPLGVIDPQIRGGGGTKKREKGREKTMGVLRSGVEGFGVQF